ncbi:hypothetical protein BBJ28_00017593 [Nothophytophthora sp. Chile5]|nr:hypothetical protein BBJ28_00017593 [Nothophytophthora sp. Chile5]
MRRLFGLSTGTRATNGTIWWIRIWLYAVLKEVFDAVGAMGWKEGMPSVEPVAVETLIVAMPGGPQRFVQELAATWEPVGTLVTTDQSIVRPICFSISGVLLSKKGVDVAEAGNTLALLVSQEVPVAATWVWLAKLQEHVDAKELVCLDSQLSTIYADQYAASEPSPQLRMLSSSSVTEELKLLCPVRPLETPQFVTGIPAALLTHTRQFSTRFLSTDGIPEYNALLDGHLGKRREFLLGNRQSLTLLQQTGVIDHVETQPDNPNQYVVHMSDKPIRRRKRLPPRASSASLLGLPLSGDAAWRQDSSVRGLLASYSSPSGQRPTSLRRTSASTPHLKKPGASTADNNGEKATNAALKAQIAALKGLGKSSSTSVLMSGTSKPPASPAASRLTLFGSTKPPATSEDSSQGDGEVVKTAKRLSPALTASETRRRSCSVVPMTASPAIAELQTKKTAAASAAASQTAVKGTVEHLLESDAAFMAQIRSMKEQLAELEATKTRLDAETGRLRRKVRGVNAVRENDVAVAHCSSIMQHRLSKAEEEFMKLVTQQQEVRKDVDRVRHELLSLRKVRHKLQTDIQDVTQAKQAVEEKIHAAKGVRNQVSEELSELERRAEVELEEQRLTLPPEDAVVVDVAKLMSAVQERKVARRNASTVGLGGFGAGGLSAVNGSLAEFLPSTASAAPSGSDKASPVFNDQRGDAQSHGKPLLDYFVREPVAFRRTAFRMLQNSLGFADVSAFEQQFTATEEQLLSRYKANLALADELATLQKELNAVNTEKMAKRAIVRGGLQASELQEREMQTRVHTVMSRIKAYNELREQRGREHTRLRAIMLRCLETLHTDAGPSELPKSEDGGSYNSAKGSSGDRAMQLSELPSPALLETLQRKMTQVAVALKVAHSSRILELPPEALILNRGLAGRRSNMFSTREASKIVMGPREPSGSALSAILGTAQPPSVETAMALTESLSLVDVMHGLHRGSSPGRGTRGPLSTDSATSRVLGVLGVAGERPRKAKTTHFGSEDGGGNGMSLASMTEADREDEEADDEPQDEEDEEEEEGEEEEGSSQQGEEDDGLDA